MVFKNGMQKVFVKKTSHQMNLQHSLLLLLKLDQQIIHCVGYIETIKYGFLRLSFHQRSKFIINALNPWKTHIFYPRNFVANLAGRKYFPQIFLRKHITNLLQELRMSSNT